MYFISVTKLTNSHCVQATLFFALPGGSGLEYNLSGTAEAPKPINRISREVPCKTEYTEPLTVENWLSKPQRLAIHTLNHVPSLTFNMMTFQSCGVYVLL